MNEIINTPLVVPQQQPALPPASKLLGWSFSYYKQHLPVIGGIASVPFLFGVAQIISGVTLPAGLFVPVVLIAVVVSFLSRLAIFDAVSEEGQTIGSAFKKGLKMIFPFMWVSFLASLAVIGGLFLFIVPGILICIWLSMSLYILFVENKKGMDALAASWHYVKGYSGALFWRYFFFILMLIVASIIVGAITSAPDIVAAIKNGEKPGESMLSGLINLALNSFLILPLSIIYSFGIYRALKEIKTIQPSEADEKKTRKNIVTFSVIGIAGIIIAISVGVFLFIKFLPQLMPAT